eukprot:Gb_38056 [translate_table: standard]
MVADDALDDGDDKFKRPQVTIATSIMFCHRFYLRQSHHKNDRYIIATACMVLAGKVEETPRKLRDVTMVAYEVRHKRDPASAERIKQKEFYEQEKELVILAERVVLGTLAFDLNVHHPYKYLVSAIKIFKVAQNSLAQVAWNFINDGLLTTLCLQFRPQHIAAGAIFLAAKFLKVKLPSDGERPWWQEFGVTPRQLEDVSNQMLELYEQSKSITASDSVDIGTHDTDDELKIADKDVSQGHLVEKSLYKINYARKCPEDSIPSRQEREYDNSTDQTLNVPIKSEHCSFDAMIGHESVPLKCTDQKSAFLRPVTNWQNKVTSEVIHDSERLASTLASVDTHATREVKRHASEVRNVEHQGNQKPRMQPMDESWDVSFSGNDKSGIAGRQLEMHDLLESKYLERTDLGEERKRKRKSHWNDSLDVGCPSSPRTICDQYSRFNREFHVNTQDTDLSNVTRNNEHAQPKGKTMASKQEKGSNEQWRNSNTNAKFGQNMNKELYHRPA